MSKPFETVFVTMKPPRYGDLGVVEEGHYRTIDDVVSLVDINGVQRLDRKGKPIQHIPVGGVGFVFDGRRDEDGLVFAGIDFDKVISGGEIASIAQERIRRLGSYT